MPEDFVVRLVELAERTMRIKSHCANEDATRIYLVMPFFELLGYDAGDPSVARPGPNIDSDLELMRFFDQHLRGGPQAGARRGQIFVRRPTPAEPDLALHDGHWVEVDVWPPTHLRRPRRCRGRPPSSTASEPAEPPLNARRRP